MAAVANIGDASAQTFAELLSGPLVDVFVGAGDNRRQWSLHRNLLSYHSEYLASELQTNDATKNKAGNRLELPEDDPKGFELLVKWLYQGKIEDVSDIADNNAKYEFAVACHKLYVLCERFDMPQLKNMAIDKYRKGLKQARLVPDAEEINEIYQKSPEGSPFRALMTKIAARQIMDPESDRDADSYRSCFENNPDFAIDLVNAIKAGTGGMLFDDPTSGDECEYHDHEDGPNCHNKGKGKEGAEAAIRKPRFRPKSPPSPPKTPPETPFQTPHTHPTTGGRRKSKSPTKVAELDTKHGVNGGENGSGGDSGNSSPTANAVPPKPRPVESGIGPESPGGRSPKRNPPKLRRRGSTSAKHPIQGNA